ncbi:hypothetical protein QUA43_30035 [Microcoleus sp. N9_B4]|uniref:hypothetical protein n=1 Tax=Microcoleus sp. N9_B4 TaxID=3055386 RepID=UPI002FD68A0A
MTELHAVSSLQARYDLASRQAVYDRIAALNIKQVSRGKLSTEQLDKLDRLDKWLKANPHSAIADFPQEPEVMEPESSVISHQPSVNSLSTESLDNSQQSFDLLELAESFARHLSKLRDPLQHYAALERAIASSWLLSSSEVRALIGTKPTGDRFQRGSFVFIRSGKMGNQSAWRVAKVIEGGVYKI